MLPIQWKIILLLLDNYLSEWLNIRNNFLIRI